MAHGRNLSRMSTSGQIITLGVSKDAEGFTTRTETVVATVRMLHEQTKQQEKSADGSSTYVISNDTFYFRHIPNVTLTTSHYIKYNSKRYNIISVDDADGRQMYYEVKATETESADG